MSPDGPTRRVPGRPGERLLTGLVAAGGLAAVLLVGACPAASATTTSPSPTPPAPVAARPAVEAPLVGDDHPGLLERRRRDARDTAVVGAVDGTLVDAGTVRLPAAEAARPSSPSWSPYTERATTGTDQVLTLLVDFGTGDFGDRTWNGPVHGQPTPAVTATPSGSEPEHYAELLFGDGPSSLAGYLGHQSGGRYGIAGSVHGWVGVPNNAAYYGVDACGGSECPSRVGELVTDALDAFVEDFYATDPTGDLAAALRPYDQRDRYDHDADGDFTEPDGYLDRLVLVFAGAAQSAGPATSPAAAPTGSGAVRSAAVDPAGVIDEVDRLRTRFGSVAGDLVGSSGPVRNPAGGHQLGSSGVWVDSFSLVPEDVTLGTLVHTYGHELGLLDLADPAGHAGVDSSVQFWSPMAGGTRLPAPAGSAPPDLLAAERLQLGWLDYEVVRPDEHRDLRLADELTGPPASGATGAAVVPLGTLVQTTPVGAPAIGERAYVAAIGSSTEAVLALPVDREDVRVGWRQWTDTEPLFDPLRVQAQVGGQWTDIAPATTGATGWTARSAALPADVTAVRFVYATDGAATGTGVLLDDIRIGTRSAEGAENGLPAGWTATGWQLTDGTATVSGPGLYIVERRDLAEHDAALLNAPYVADPRAGSTAVDHFGYGGGALVTFWDRRAVDNAVSSHPRSGRLLVVDARPEPLRTESGAVAPAGLHPFDAAFGTSWLRGFAVDGYAVTPAGEIRPERVRVRAQPPVPAFDDRDDRYTLGGDGQPTLPGVGVTLTVVGEGATDTAVRLGPSAR